MWTIVFPGHLFQELRELLFSKAPSEFGCFLTANHFKRGRNDVLLVAAIVKPALDSWNYSEKDRLAPNSSYINQAVISADKAESSLLFVHTHPSMYHPPDFSLIDKRSNKRLFGNISQILGDRPLGSLVFSQKGLHGVVFDKGKIRPVSAFVRSGHLISAWPSSVETPVGDLSVDDPFDRQARAVGSGVQSQLQKISVTIVGVGGTGSAAAVQLARMGVGKLRLIDNDVVDRTNIPRLYGARIKDVGKPKVDVLKRHIASFSMVRLEAICASVTEDPIPQLLDSDVIMGCTDNLSSRAVLNDVSLQYAIPLVDVGCRIHLTNDGSIAQAISKVQVVTPDDACLWCTGTLDAKLILQESLSPNEKAKLSREGYYSDVGRQPSIISLTTLAATMGVNKILSLLGVFGSDYGSVTQVELYDGFMINDTPSIKADCVCQERRCIATKRRATPIAISTALGNAMQADPPGPRFVESSEL
jgi:hypothetical protein